MRLAIIGGGASGLVAAWSLAADHEVVLFEADAVLGGNIRTLGRNAKATGPLALADGLHLDAGVIEFPRPSFRRFHALMRVLEVELASVPGTSGLFLADGERLLSPQAILQMDAGVREKTRAFRQLMPLLAEREAFLRATTDLDSAELNARAFVDYIPPGRLRTWLRLMCTYAWSMPLDSVDQIPAALAVPVMRAALSHVEWSCIVGGAHVYVERILDQLARDGARVHVSCPVVGIKRGETSVSVEIAEGSRFEFGAVVLAVTPDRVLSLLRDPDAAEQAWFERWQGNDALTLVHADMGMYTRRRTSWFSEFDVFETGPTTGGYDAYLNRLCQVPPGHGHFGLAFGMEHEIDPSLVVHRQLHHSPRYTIEAMARRDEVRRANGRRRTWFAGAWMFDGLHEGAVEAGLAIAAALGGRTLALD